MKDSRSKIGANSFQHSIWEERNISTMIKQRRASIIIIVVMWIIYISFVVLLIYLLNVFRIIWILLIISVMAVVLGIQVYKFLLRRIMRDSQQLQNHIKAEIFVTRKGYENVHKELLKLFETHNIKLQKSGNLWGIHRKFKTKSGENLLIFEFDKQLPQNAKIKIFESKEYPKSKRILKEFFEKKMFSEPKRTTYIKTDDKMISSLKGKNYIKANDETREYVKNDEQRQWVRYRISSLKKEIRTPWFEYIFGGGVALFSLALFIEAIIPPVELASKFSMIVMGLCGLIIGLGFAYVFHSMNKSKEVELEGLRKVSKELYRQRQQYKDEEGGP
jgi:energy-coupling factor transporter transmembrane protein EcfT